MKSKKGKLVPTGPFGVKPQAHTIATTDARHWSQKNALSEQCHPEVIHSTVFFDVFGSCDGAFGL